jgi:polar amino acid transport system substrate-binding protein
MNHRTTFKTMLSAALFLGAATISAQADAIDDIKAAGQLNVGIFSDFPPFSSAAPT